MRSALVAYSYLGLAILFEVTGSIFLQMSQQLTKLVPTLTVVAFYGVSFWSLSQALKSMPLGVAYAIWSGLGIVLTAAISVVIFKQVLDMAAIIGIAMIVSGVVFMQLFSQSATH
ncbi:DMT family transporter [Phyllobacterium sophorae]|uniref:QacE family quaternary ammonium compound efflux SMR transporter n=1 Tax=Phyllobacterium sophorae TaxID=1520277 RepID=A0A2P7AMZ3_9HYPH|nr:multidrug efflux SMR transporter [Phyllobacterium sophorae]PSH55570.1 QacE family quaternary ammonium compound efflux SMR transporter [Phyllobacterium sophorae]